MDQERVTDESSDHTWQDIRSHVRIEIIVLIVSLVAGAIIRLYLAFTAPINMDENFYAFDGHLLEQGLTPFQDYPSRSPLMIIISATILRLGGDFFTLRIAAVIFSIATGLLIFQAGRILGGDRLGALSSALFFLSPYSIRYGYVFFTQPFEAFFVGLSFTILIRWVSTTYSTATGDSPSIHGSSRGPDATSPDPLIDNGGLLSAVLPYRSLLISGIILGSAVFIRRNALAFFPAGFLILLYYQYSLSRSGSNRDFFRDTGAQAPHLVFTIGFLIALVPGILAFMMVSGLSYTTYFFYSDYLRAHSSVIGNISFSLLYFDTRGYYFMSMSMIFLTAIMVGLRDRALRIQNIPPSSRNLLQWVVPIFLIIGWSVSFIALMGNNNLDSEGGHFQGVVLVLLFLSFMVLSYLRSGRADEKADGKVDEKAVEKFGEKADRGWKGGTEGKWEWMHGHFVPALIVTFISFLIILSTRQNYFYSLTAIIFLNMGSIAFLYHRVGSFEAGFVGRSRSGFPSPHVASGLFFICVLLFYLMFRVILPYYYDLLFPLCIITAGIVLRTMDSFNSELQDLVGAAKAVFMCTLILSLSVSVITYEYHDTKQNETDIGEFNDCVAYLEEHADPGEEIFAAKATIPLQAGLENIFNIVRPAAYLEKDEDRLEHMDYPSIGEIIERLENRTIPFIVVDWVMQTYFLENYPELDAYVNEHYLPVEVFGSITIMQRS